MRGNLREILMELGCEGFNPEGGASSVTINKASTYDTIKIVVHLEMLTVIQAIVAKYEYLYLDDKM